MHHFNRYYENVTRFQHMLLVWFYEQMPPKMQCIFIVIIGLFFLSSAFKITAFESRVTVFLSINQNFTFNAIPFNKNIT